MRNVLAYHRPKKGRYERYMGHLGDQHHLLADCQRVVIHGVLSQLHVIHQVHAHPQLVKYQYLVQPYSSHLSFVLFVQQLRINQLLAPGFLHLIIDM